MSGVWVVHLELFLNMIISLHWNETCSCLLKKNKQQHPKTATNFSTYFFIKRPSCFSNRMQNIRRYTALHLACLIIFTRFYCQFSLFFSFHFLHFSLLLIPSLSAVAISLPRFVPLFALRPPFIICKRTRDQNKCVEIMIVLCQRVFSEEKRVFAFKNPVHSLTAIIL